GQCGAGRRQRVLRAELPRALVAGAHLGRVRAAGSGRLAGVAGAVAALVHLVADDRLEAHPFPLRRGAPAVAEGAVVAGAGVAARAHRVAGGEADVVGEVVLTGRPHAVDAQTAQRRRLVPDGVGEPRVELGAVVAAGVA